MKTIYWKKGVFSSTYQLFTLGTPIGNLHSKTWSNDATATINAKRYTFKTKGFLSQSTLIVDNDINRIVGRITYNSWRTKALIELENTTAELKSENILNSVWGMRGKNGESIKYSFSMTSGTITYSIADDTLVIAGLYAKNFFSQSSIGIFIAIFLPLYIVLYT